MTAHYRHLTLNDRIEIGRLLDLNTPRAEIARQLGVHRSTITRELARGAWQPERDHANLRLGLPVAGRAQGDQILQAVGLRGRCKHAEGGFMMHMMDAFAFNGPADLTGEAVSLTGELTLARTGSPGFDEGLWGAWGTSAARSAGGS